MAINNESISCNDLIHSFYSIDKNDNNKNGMKIENEEIQNLVNKTFEKNYDKTEKKITPEKVNASKDSSHILIAQGKVKKIWIEKNNNSNRVKLTAKDDKYYNTIIGSKEDELKNEVNIAKNIQSGLFRCNLENFLLNKKDNKMDKIHVQLLINILTLNYKSTHALTEDLKKINNDKEAKEKFMNLYYMDESLFDKIHDFFIKGEEDNTFCGGDNIAFDLNELDKNEWVDEKYTISTSKAKGDMEAEIRKEKPFSERVRLSLQFVNGMRALHQSGHVCGDIKPENILYFENGDLKISDFGKTKKLGKDETMIHSGNPRYAPPEGRISQLGEVYSSGLVIIRLIEEEFLLDKENMLMDNNLEKMDLDFKEIDKRRRGVERFLIANKNCPQKETTSFLGQINFVIKQIKLWYNPSNTGDLEKAEKDLGHYIDCLKNKLLDKYANETDAINELGKLLKDMTLSDSKSRPSMQNAYLELKSIFSRIEKNRPSRK
jgi:serine/threonine protein kinase